MTTRDELGATLVQLRRRVDDHFEAAVARTPTAFRCASGCDACCHVRIGVFAVEAAPIAAALARLAREDPALRRRVRQQADDPAHQHHCALLVDGRCSVYDQRPLICRSHGLPVLATSDPIDPADPPSAPRVDHCPLNFVDQPPPRASILRLEAVNHPLAVLASLWSTTTGGPGRSPDPGTRIALADLARAHDLGPGRPRMRVPARHRRVVSFVRLPSASRAHADRD